MPRIISPEVRLEAMGLYVSGDHSAKEITEKIADKFDIAVTVSTIYSWSKKFNWDKICNDFLNHLKKHDIGDV